MLLTVIAAELAWFVVVFFFRRLYFISHLFCKFILHNRKQKGVVILQEMSATLAGFKKEKLALGFLLIIT